MIVDICTLGYGGIMMIANAILGSTLWTTCTRTHRGSLNKGVIPGRYGNGWDASDSRVYMFVDRKDSKAKTAYQVRESCKLPDFGYYSPTSTFGYLKQVS